MKTGLLFIDNRPSNDNLFSDENIPATNDWASDDAQFSDDTHLSDGGLSEDDSIYDDTQQSGNVHFHMVLTHLQLVLLSCLANLAGRIFKACLKLSSFNGTF